MLDEELIDLMTFCLQNPDSAGCMKNTKESPRLVTNFMLMVELMLWRTFFVLKNRIIQEIEKDPSTNVFAMEWSY